ncbi:NfeD family protein [Lutibacter sp. B2]|nr:NfeD family protein [Lutibacter sp. B2]
MIIIFVAVEIFTLGLTTIWFAIGSLMALIAAWLELSVLVQVFIFLITSIALLYFTKPITKKYLKIGITRTNVDALIGEIGIVIKKIEKFNTGQVKLLGQIWSAKSEDHEEIEENESVKVIRIEGVKIIVKKWSQ